MLIDHIAVTLQSLLGIHPNAGVIISGDRNNIDIPVLLSIDPSLRQTVRHNTRGDRILDVIVTNLSKFFNEPEIIPPINPDRPGHGVPSDHNGVEATPRVSMSQPPTRTKVRKMIRPLPDSLLFTFQSKLRTQNFEMLRGMNIQEMVSTFQNVVNTLLCDTFPEKTIIISPEDKPWFTEGLRLLKRQRLRHYQRHGKDEKYNDLQLKFDQKMKSEMKNILTK